MALTWTLLQDGEDVWGKQRVKLMKAVAAASDYVTNGYAYTAATFGYTQLNYVELVSSPLGWTSQTDTVNNKMVVYGGSAGSGLVAGQAAAATDFSTSQGWVVRAFGR
jgi:hypothetical protein